MHQTTRDIPANDFKALWQDIEKDVVAAVRRVGESGWYVLGKEVARFETELAGFWGLSQAVGCASGLDAIEIGLRAGGLRPGDKVLTTPLSAFATTLAICRAGGVPVFVDTDASGLIDPNACRTALLADRSIRFFVPVHLYGIALDGGKLAALRDGFDLTVIEDCAQAIGATSFGKPVGRVGQSAAISFYPTKNLGAIGDAGALLTDDNALADDARCLRDYGQTTKYAHDRLGLNSRLDELQAAILSDAMLPRLARWNERRREIASAYLAGLSNPSVSTLALPEGSTSAWHLFPLRVPGSRDAFLRHLRENGITGGIHYPSLIPSQRAMAETSFEIQGLLTNAEALAREEVSLPIHPYLSQGETERVIDCVNRWHPSSE